jgi:hypothetical protein
VTSITSALVGVKWQQPLSDGGCSITSFHLYLKPVTDTDWIEIDAAYVNYKPYLQQYEIDTSLYPVGADYLIKMTVDNIVGTDESDSTVFLLADVPG